MGAGLAVKGHGRFEHRALGPAGIYPGLRIMSTSDTQCPHLRSSMFNVPETAERVHGSFGHHDPIQLGVLRVVFIKSLVLIIPEKQLKS